MLSTAGISTLTALARFMAAAAARGACVKVGMFAKLLRHRLPAAGWVGWISLLLAPSCTRVSGGLPDRAVDELRLRQPDDAAQRTGFHDGFHRLLAARRGIVH